MKKISLSNRFWSKVDKSQPCWLWTAAKHRKGYGWFRVHKEPMMAHRVAYILANGPIPLGLHVLHSCDTPACVNPEHLFLGTNQENVDDKVRKNRQYKPNHKGSRHTQATVDEAVVLQIRQDHATGNYQHKDLAKKYGTTTSIVGKIVRRERWTHI